MTCSCIHVNVLRIGMQDIETSINFVQCSKTTCHKHFHYVIIMIVNTCICNSCFSFISSHTHVQYSIKNASLE